MRAILVVTALVLMESCSPERSGQIHANTTRSGLEQATLAAQDREFLEDAAQGNNAEIAIGSLAERHALRGDVAAFGSMLVVDHNSANTTLAAVAARKRVSLPTSLGEHQQGFDRVAGLSVNRSIGSS